jgi:hypothetical protein
MLKILLKGDFLIAIILVYIICVLAVSTAQAQFTVTGKSDAASMAQWGATMSADFLQQPGVAYEESATSDTQLQQIMLQKYYAYFFVDFQSWFEKRRTGYPILPRGTGIPAENNFPSRIPYPTYLQSLNPANLEAAVTAMGGDNSDVKVWWDK